MSPFEGSRAHYKGDRLNAATEALIAKWNTAIDKASTSLTQAIVDEREAREALTEAQKQLETADTDEVRSHAETSVSIAERKLNGALIDKHAACDSLSDIAKDSFNEGHFAVAKRAASLIPVDAKILKTETDDRESTYFKEEIFKFFFRYLSIKHLVEPTKELQKTDRPEALRAAGTSFADTNAVRDHFHQEAEAIRNSSAFEFMLWCASEIRSDQVLARSLSTQEVFWGETLPRMAQFAARVGSSKEIVLDLVETNHAFAKHSRSHRDLGVRALVQSALVAAGVGPYTEFTGTGEEPLTGKNILYAIDLLDTHKTGEDEQTWNSTIAHGYYMILTLHTIEDLLDAGVTSSRFNKIMKKIEKALVNRSWYRTLESRYKDLRDAESRRGQTKKAA